jgi:hypothetical protein
VQDTRTRKRIGNRKWIPRHQLPPKKRQSVIASHSRIDETVEMDREGIASVIIIADQVACFNGKGSSYL